MIVRWRQQARFQGDDVLAEIDLVLATIAILFDPPEVTHAITQEQLSNVLSRPLNIGHTPDGRLLVNSNRDQIEIQLFPNKIDVRDLSGILAKAKEKVPEAVSKIMAVVFQDAPPNIHTYGINIVVEVPVVDPNTWMGKTFLKEELSAFFGPPISSNEIAIRANEPPKTIIVKILSRDDSRININFSASEETESLPDMDRLAEELEIFHARTLKLVEDIKA